MPCLPIILINFSWATSNSTSFMKKSRLNCLEKKWQNQFITVCKKKIMLNQRARISEKYHRTRLNTILYHNTQYNLHYKCICRITVSSIHKKRFTVMYLVVFCLLHQPLNHFGGKMCEWLYGASTIL